MDRIGNILKARRQQMGLKIEEISERTKIRPHLIKSIEGGERDVMPTVYIKSFVKTYAEFLGFSETEIEGLLHDIEPTKPAKISNIVKADSSGKAAVKPAPRVESKPEKEKTTPKRETEARTSTIKEETDRSAVKPKAQDVESTDTTNYKELFKKKSVKKSSNVNVSNIVIYALLIIGVVAIIYFTFFYDTAVDSPPPSSIDTNKKETPAKEESSGILSYFETPDSLSLTAKARDTVWIRLEIDGVKSEEMIIKPGQEAVWHAKNFFVVSHGNIGAVEFSLEGKKLPLFGKRRTVARNIKITKDEVIGISQEAAVPQTPAPGVAPTDRQTPRTDSPSRRSRRYSSRKKDDRTPPPMILESAPVKPVPPSFNSKKNPRPH